MTLEDEGAARDWVSAGLALTCIGDPTEGVLREGASVLRAAGEVLDTLPPPGFLLDLARLFHTEGQQLRRGARPKHLRAYEDNVLGRLALHPLRGRLTDALRRLPPDRYAEGIAVLADRLLDHLGFDAGHAVHPRVLRTVARVAEDDWQTRAQDALNGPAGALLEESYHALVSSFQRTGQPLRPSDVTLIEQLELLDRRSDRLALEQVVTMASRLSALLPRRMRSTRRREGHVSTRLEDEDAYPVGGFSSISTQGSIENLVTSELALMEDGPDVDLFDVRYTEGELLFYTRDETAFVRARRRVTLTLDGSLDSARFRDPGLPVQRLVLALGWTVAVVTHLADWLDRQDLHIRIVLDPLLHAEERLLRLALADGLAAGWLELALLPRDAVRPLLEADVQQAPTDHVALTAKGAVPPPPPHCWQTVLTCSAIPALHAPFAGQPALPEAPLTAWQTALAHALSDLL